MSSTTIPSSLRALPHGIDITAPGGTSRLLAFHRATFGDAQMNVGTGSGDGEKPKPTPPRTFSQEELNAVAAEERRKTAERFADYEDLKAKAAKLDLAEQESQTELQRAIARAEKAEKDAATEREGRALADRQVLAATVASEKSVPMSHISGTTREELEASADQLLAWRSGSAPAPQEQQQVGGYVASSGTGQQGPVPVAPLGGRARALEKHSKSKN